MSSFEKINVSIFSGGRGTRNIFGALSGVPLNIDFLINGYDSGLSTGKARWAFEGMLGPSDYRKTLSTLLSQGSQEDRQLAQFLENRLMLREYGKFSKHERWSALSKNLPKVSYEKGKWIEESLENFLSSKPVINKLLDLDDFSVGNAIFCSSFIENDSNFNLTLKEISNVLLGNSHVRVLNVTSGADLWLIGISGNEICVDEGFLVNHSPKKPIERLLLVEREVVKDLWQKYSDWTEASGTLIDSLLGLDVKPKISAETKESLNLASLIIYGSGTLHSSLLPSYTTQDVGIAITNNRNARKILFVNGERDLDFSTSEGQGSLLTKTVAALGVDRACDAISDIFISNIWSGDMSFQETLKEKRFNQINILRNSLGGNSKYSESDAYIALSSIISELTGHVLAPSNKVISIVAPNFNEVNLLPRFLADFIPYVYSEKWACEKIIVDSCSNDGSFEILQNSDAYSLLRLSEKDNFGRFSAIKKGVLAARGKFVVIFHTDAEYSIINLNKLITAAIANPDALIIGSRTTNGYGASGLRDIYGKNKTLYWISRLGGVVLGTVVALRLGRPISDPFCGILVGNRDLLQTIIPGEGDIDAQVKLFYSCKQLQIPIIEVALDYTPRPKHAGKKTNFAMGLTALATAVFNTTRL
jgi:2-phospho-L-lactate transferase/gluconeogenesis factor (CofD/UPF0052 family)